MLPGLFVSRGGKLTSARADAARIIDAIQKALDVPRVPCPTAKRSLPWAPEWDFGFWKAEAARTGVLHGLDETTAMNVAMRCGSTAGRLWAVMREDKDLAVRIHPGLPFCRAEVVHAFREEMAVGLEDALRRRIPLLILAPWRELAIEGLADLAAAEAQWTPERRSAEIDSLRKKYGGGG